MIYLKPGDDSDRGLDVIYNYVDDAFLDGRFQEIDEFIEGVDLSVLSITQILGLLTVSASAKDKLENRDEFFIRCRDELVRRKESPESVESLLSGLQ